MTFQNKEDRDELIEKIQENKKKWPIARAGKLQFKILEDKQRLLLKEYSDRIPRWVFSRCPLTGALFKSAIDPYGLDGPFWDDCRTYQLDQPTPPTTYKVHLGAMDLHGRQTTEAGRFYVRPGPEVPFVIPTLMDLPGMFAVMSSFDLHCGDTCYIIAYFSSANIPAGCLHSNWLEREFWFKTASGHSAWTYCTALWDFDLAPYVASGRLMWIEKSDPTWTLKSSKDGHTCPYVELPGKRKAQLIDGPKMILRDPPHGESMNPFANR